MPEMTLKPEPSVVNLDTTDLSEIRMVLMSMIMALNAGPRSRERSLVITKLEEARLWAGEGMMKE